MADIERKSATSRIDLAREPEFDLGRMRVKPAERSVAMNGARHELQPRVMQVLVALNRAQPDVVSRDILIEQCWDGRIVGDDALNRCILALRHLAEEFTPTPFAIETVPRIGHRLVVPQEPKALPASQVSKSQRWAVVTVLALLLLAAVGLFVWHQRSAAPEPAAIAVLPFRNLGSGDPYFAEGVGEEILGQLAREPHFRVIGRGSSSQFGENPDLDEVARRLAVDYVIEGSVRRQGDAVRVNAGLVRASDGIRLWSDSYNGKLDDTFAIQQRIGTAVALALERKLVRAPAPSRPLVTNGEAYNLYLTARGLIRTRNRNAAPTASDLLKDAIQIDPEYAPAWASLSEATLMQGALGDREAFIAANRQARSYAQRAVALAPNLAEAHGALGRTYGLGDPNGMAHLRRGAELDPNNAERLIDLGTALAAVGEFERELAAYRRANRIDPLWYRTTGTTAIALATRGDRAGAEALGRTNLPDKGATLNILLGRIASVFADYSEAARRWSTVARSNSPRWANTAERSVYGATHAVGLETGTLVDVATPIAGRDDWRAWLESAPTPAAWRARNRDSVAAEVYRKHNLVAAKLMLNAGRWRELTATYDSPAGLFGLRPGTQLRVDQLHEVPIIVLALRQAGRAAEANRLLRNADAATRTVYSRGRVPFWFDADAAALFAVEGRHDEALDALEHAYERGWRQNGNADLRDIADEPAFRSLHGEPRFMRLQALLTAHYARERREVVAVLGS